MEITPLTGGVQSQKTDKTDKNEEAERNAPNRLRSVVNQIVRETDSVLEGQSTASQLQARESGFRQAANSLARVSSLAQTAEDGVREVRTAVARLRNADANETRQIRENIDRVARETRFEERPLLDGSREEISLQETLAGNESGVDDVTLTLPDVRSTRLLGEEVTPERVDQALRALDSSLSEVRDFRQSVGVVAASIDTAAANREAAQAELQDADLDQNLVRDIRENRETATRAQANNINPALVKLVS